MVISVIIPTYKRTKELQRCLEALNSQTRRAEEVIIVVREYDTDTLDIIKKIKTKFLFNLEIVTVDIPGQLAALNKGLEVASGDILCFTDDDAEPFPDWIERIEKAFKSEPSLGGIGGKDVILQDGKEVKGRSKRVGKLLWYGRMVGNHHLELVPPLMVKVDVIKGVNMAFRRSFIENYRFDMKMNNISSPCNEFDICFHIRKEGGEIVYDPTLKVYHYPAPRKMGAQRKDVKTIEEYSQNYTYVMLKHLPFFKKIIFVLYFFLIGQRASYGPLLFILDYLLQKKPSSRSFLIALKGKFKGVWYYLF